MFLVIKTTSKIHRILMDFPPAKNTVCQSVKISRKCTKTWLKCLMTSYLHWKLISELPFWHNFKDFLKFVSKANKKEWMRKWSFDYNGLSLWFREKAPAAGNGMESIRNQVLRGPPQNYCTTVLLENPILIKYMLSCF